MAKLTEEAKRTIGNIRPSLITTASRVDKSNISTTGLMHVLDDEHVILADVSSCGVTANILENGQVAIICLAIPGRKGCLLYGQGEVLEPGDEFDNVAAEFDKNNIKVRNMVKVRVEDIETFY